LNLNITPESDERHIVLHELRTIATIGKEGGEKDNATIINLIKSISKTDNPSQWDGERFSEENFGYESFAIERDMIYNWEPIYPCVSRFPYEISPI
jgi:hypothetical protein